MYGSNATCFGSTRSHHQAKKTLKRLLCKFKIIFNFLLYHIYYTEQFFWTTWLWLIMYFYDTCEDGIPTIYMDDVK
jgi:hypothetical protein